MYLGSRMLSLQSKRRAPLLSEWNKDFITVQETDHFKVMIDPNRNPLDKENASYLLVFKKYNTIEASANSMVIILSFLNEAEEGYLGLLSKQKAKAEQEVEALPTLN
jgi:hypothetical protein